MYEAVIRGDIGIMDLLMEVSKSKSPQERASFILKYPFNFTNIFQIAVFNRTGSVAYLINHLIHLMRLQGFSQEKIISLLNESDTNGRTALHLASESPNYETLETLLINGAKLFNDSSINSFVQDKNGQTPLHYLCKNKVTKEMISLFKKYFATIRPDKSGKTPVDYVTQNVYLTKELKKEILEELSKTFLRSEDQDEVRSSSKKEKSSKKLEKSRSKSKERFTKSSFSMERLIFSTVMISDMANLINKGLMDVNKLYKGKTYLWHVIKNKKLSKADKTELVKFFLAKGAKPVIEKSNVYELIANHPEYGYLQSLIINFAKK